MYWSHLFNKVADVRPAGVRPASFLKSDSSAKFS